jgi:predicted PurR-regulated permease PerM
MTHLSFPITIWLETDPLKANAMTEFKIADPLLRRLVYVLGIMAVFIVGLHTLSLLKNALAFMLGLLTPFLAAMLLAYIFAPLVTALQQRLHLGRLAVTLLLYLLLAAALFLAIFVLVPQVLSELKALLNMIRQAVPDALSRLAASRYFPVDETTVSTVARVFKDADLDYVQILGNLWPTLKNLASGGVQAVGQVSSAIYSSLLSIVGFIFFFAFVGIINFYLILDWNRVGPFIRAMVPPDRRDRIFDILVKIDTGMGGFLRGQLTVAAIVGTSFAAGLFALGFVGFPGLRNYCILIGTVAALAGFIPYLGAVIGVTPAVLIVLLTGDASAQAKFTVLIAVLGLFVVIQATEGFVLQPKIVGKGVGLHPLIVMLALVGGAQFGIGGMMVAVPLATVIRILLREYYGLSRLTADPIQPQDDSDASP